MKLLLFGVELCLFWRRSPCGERGLKCQVILM